MKFFKKLLTLGLASVLACSCVACGGREDDVPVKDAGKTQL